MPSPNHPGAAGAPTARRVLAPILDDLRRRTWAAAAEIHAGEDPEPLHRLRVAVRRARTAIRTLLREASGDEGLERLAGELRWLGALTGDARDLDVLAARLGDPRRAPAGYQASHGDVGEALAGARKAAYGRIRDALGSARFSSLGRLWQDGARDPATEGGPPPSKAAAPLAEALDEFRAALETAVRSGAGRDLHRLRIRGKRLRYLLEFFREHLPTRRAEAAVGALEDLQDRLGEHHDLGQQAAWLRAAGGAGASRSGELAAALDAERSSLEKGIERRLREVEPRVLRPLASALREASG